MWLKRIERQAQYAVDLYNVDVRRDQRFMAEQGIVPCTGEHDDRFSPYISHNLSVLEIRIRGNPSITSSCTDAEVIHGRTERLTGETKTVLMDLFGLVESYNPDVILMPDADTRMPKIRKLAQQYDLVMPFSRNGKVQADGFPFVLELRKNGAQGRCTCSGRPYPYRHRTIVCVP